MNNVIEQLINEANERIDELYADLDAYYIKVQDLESKISEAVHHGKFINACDLAHEMANVFAMMDACHKQIAHLEKQISMHK